MGYLKISNLYKDQTIMMFKEVYALEKIHGTSAHIAWKNGKLSFFSGGESHERFVGLFDVPVLTEMFKERFGEDDEIVVFGEAYGGKQQGMSATYGKELKFIVFDVKIGEYWLEVPNANHVADYLCLEFVAWNRIPADIAAIDAERDRPSRQAMINGIDEDKPSEGVVLRPVLELRDKRGNRIIAKHKGEKFAERKNVPPVDEAQLAVLEEATEIAEEWVVPMRLTHVLDKLGNTEEMSDIPKIIKAMIDDVMVEGAGEIVDSRAVRAAIGKKTVFLFKEKLENKLRDM